MIVLEIIVDFPQSYSIYIYQMAKKDTESIALDWYKSAQKYN
jgi:hypothetical protein